MPKCFGMDVQREMIGEQNKLKRLNWAIAHLHEAETGFKDVVWTDECTVQLESHRRICCLKGGEAPKNKQRYRLLT